MKRQSKFGVWGTFRRSVGIARMHKRRRKRKGLATIEMALVAPLLFLMVLGIMGFGYLFFVHHNMVYIARDAARSLAIQQSSVAQAQTLIANRLGDVGALNFNVTISVPDPDDPADVDVVVEITTPLQEASLNILPGAGTLRAKSTMRQEG